MWPWEHAAVAYLLYSLYRRAAGRGPPTGAAAAVVVAAAVAPDVVDKTLSWGLGLFPAGYSVAHSAFVALPVGLAALAAAARDGRRAVGVAFVVGYWSHLAGDVCYPLALGDGLAVERVLWPAVSLPAYESRLGLVDRTLLYLSEYGEAALAGRLGPLLVLELALLTGAAALWLADGRPGLAGLRRAVRAGRGEDRSDTRTVGVEQDDGE